jgi:predicted protein tyrosine phosphatase
LSADIAEKSRVKDAAEMLGALALALALVLGLALEPEDGVPLPHAAAARLRAAAPAVTTNLVAICFNETTLFS